MGVPHKLITNANPHEKSRSSEGRGVSTQQEHIHIPQFWKKDDQITAIEQVSTRPVKLNASTNTEHNMRVKWNYMEDEAFLSRYSYGGRKRKKKDSDGEYDPNHAKKLKKNKKAEKIIEKEKKVIKEA